MLARSSTAGLFAAALLAFPADHTAPSYTLQSTGALAVIAPEAFCLRYFSAEHGDRLLVVNLGIRLDLAPAPEPLLAPPAGKRWRMLWSSECVEYGGYGTPRLDQEGSGWHIPAQAAVLLAARDVDEPES